MLDVARVAVEMRDRQPQLGAQHGAGEFGDEFLGGVGRCAEAILEIASQAAGMARPVRSLVGKRGVVVIEPIEKADRRHRDTISSRFVIGRSEEHTSELKSLLRISYAVYCFNKTRT